MKAASEPDGLDLTALTAYLDRCGVHTAGPLSAELISGGRSNLTHLVGDGVHRWVLRRPPKGMILPGAHDVAREHRVMSALAGTAVPVPRMVALCRHTNVLGVPFYLMDRIDGTVLRTPDAVAALTEPVRARLGATLADTLADLHDIDYDAIGLGDLGRPDGYLQRQVDRWTKQYQKIKIRELPHVENIVATLRSLMPESTLSSIVHGDYRLDNVIVEARDPAVIAGVLDWEMATLGDPLADLATLVMFWDDPGKPVNPITRGLMAFPGFPHGDEVVERYVSRRQLIVDDVDWYLVFAEFKLAIILEQIHARHVAGQTVGDGFDGIGDMVIVLLGSAMDKIAASASLCLVSGRTLPPHALTARRYVGETLRSRRSAIQTLMMDWRLTPRRRASRSRDSIIHAGVPGGQGNSTMRAVPHRVVDAASRAGHRPGEAWRCPRGALRRHSAHASRVESHDRSRPE